MPKVCVFGGALVDRIGAMESPFVIGQSHPGSWQKTIGGVAANVARHLSHFGAKVRFATVFGDDEDAKSVRNTLEFDGLELLPGTTIPKSSTPSYTAIHDLSGDVIVGLADMDLHKHMDKAWTKCAADFGNPAEMWVADTNLSAASLSLLCELKGAIPLFIVAVSPAKTSALAHLTDKFDGLICNKAEAEAISGTSHENAGHAAESLISNGISTAIVSNGSSACAISGQAFGDDFSKTKTKIPIPLDPASQTTHLTGVGDTFAAAGIFRMLSQPATSHQAILEYANAAAHVAMLEPDTCPCIGWKTIEKLASESKD